MNLLSAAYTRDTALSQERLAAIPVAVDPPRQLSVAEESRLTELRSRGCNTWESEFCVRRQIIGEELFLQAPFSELPLESHLPGVTRAIELVKRELFFQNPVAVVGDFDVDGITANCIVTDALNRIGIPICSDAPCRQNEGYGLNLRLIDEAITKGCKLMFVVDFGSSQAELVEIAQRRGLEIVIIDHHRIRPDDKLPKASAFINPWLRGGEYCNMCAAGLAMMFTRELEQSFPTLADSAWQRGALACLGTIADVVPVLSDNRAIIRRYLPALSQVPQIQIILRKAGLSVDHLTVADVAFLLSPFFNAPARVAPMGARECLGFLQGVARDPEATAESILTWNRHRKFRERLDFEVALKSLEDRAIGRAIVVGSESFDPGVVGLVASRLTERFHRPAAVVSWCERSGGRASVRGGEKFDVFEGLTAMKEVFQRHGGHRAAGGFTIRRDRFDDLAARFVVEAQRQLGDFTPRRIQADFALSLETLSLEGKNILTALKRCEPYGEGNSAPVFYLEGVTLQDVKTFGKEHSVIELESAGTHMRAYAWRGADLPLRVRVGSQLNLGCRLGSFLSRGINRGHREETVELVGYSAA